MCRQSEKKCTLFTYSQRTRDVSSLNGSKAVMTSGTSILFFFKQLLTADSSITIQDCC